MTPKKKKRNPQDLTGRNEKAIRKWIKEVMGYLDYFDEHLYDLAMRVFKLEKKSKRKTK